MPFLLSGELARFGGRAEAGMIDKNLCEICGSRTEPAAMVSYRIVPDDIAENAGISDVAVVKLCPDCRRDLDRWYSRNVSATTYDESRRSFRSRTPQEMVREYEVSFRAFVRYRKGSGQESRT
jgi:hypothetical protein